MSIFTGAAVALITPMHEDGSINYEEMERIVNDRSIMVRMLLLSAVQQEKLLQ